MADTHILSFSISKWNKALTFSIFSSQPLHVLRFDLAYSTANSFSVFTALPPLFECVPAEKSQRQKPQTQKQSAQFLVQWATRIPFKCQWLTSRCTATFDGLLDLLLVLPAQARKPINVGSRLSCCSLPEAREVVPVWDFPIKHGGLQGNERTEANSIFHGQVSQQVQLPIYQIHVDMSREKHDEGIGSKNNSETHQIISLDFGCLDFVQGIQIRTAAKLLPLFRFLFGASLTLTDSAPWQLRCCDLILFGSGGTRAHAPYLCTRANVTLKLGSAH